MSEIVLDDVTKVFADGTEAVSSLDLDIGDGEFMVLVGPSGCGKTTALRMVAGLESISRGTIRIGERVVNTVPPKERDIAMVFQNYALYPHMTVYDNMAFGLKLRKLSRSEIDRLQHELNTTTLYVTHDQVEAMTMGDRVAVIRKGVLQQVDSPQFLYDHPSNLFVAGFIGSPAMNMVEANLSRSNGALAVEFGDFTLEVPASVISARPALKGYDGKPVVVGIRPEDMEDAS